MLRLHDNKPLEYKIVRADDWVMWDELREQAAINTPVVSYEIPMYEYNEWERMLRDIPIDRSFSIDCRSFMGQQTYDSRGNVIDDGYLRVIETIRALEKHMPEKYMPNEPTCFGSNDDLNVELDNFFDEFGGDE